MYPRPPSPAEFAPSGLFRRQISPIICIVFNMIIVHIGLAADGTLIPEPAEPSAAPARPSGGRLSPIVRQMMRRQATADLEMKDINIAVDIAQFVWGDRESRFSGESLRGDPKGDCISSTVTILSPTLTSLTRSIFQRDPLPGARGVATLSERTLPSGHNYSASASQIHVVAL